MSDNRIVVTGDDLLKCISKKTVQAYKFDEEYGIEEVTARLIYSIGRIASYFSRDNSIILSLMEIRLNVMSILLVISRNK